MTQRENPSTAMTLGLLVGVGALAFFLYQRKKKVTVPLVAAASEPRVITLTDQPSASTASAAAQAVAASDEAAESRFSWMRALPTAEEWDAGCRAMAGFVPVTRSNTSGDTGRECVPEAIAVRYNTYHRGKSLFREQAGWIEVLNNKRR